MTAAAAAALLSAAGGASAASPSEPAVRLLFSIPVPVAATNTTGGMFAFDISFVDQKTQTYYLGDRSNAAVDVANAANGRFIKQITATPPFAGVVLKANGTANNDKSGPNGVATGAGCLFAGDGPSRLVSFVLPGGTQAADISTGGANRVDEMAFDPADNLLLVANNAEDPFPFDTLVKVDPTNCHLSIVKKIVLDVASGVNATNGAEQPVWDGAKKLFFQSVPQTGPDMANGLVIGIDATGAIVRKFPVSFCQPAGLTLNPTFGELLLGCSVVFDTIGNVWDPTKNVTAAPVQVVMRTLDGRILARVRGVGSSDEVAFNGKDGHFYTGSQGSPYAPHDVTGAPLTAQGAAVLGVIDGFSLTLDQLVPTFNVPNVIQAGPPIKTIHVSGSSHSVDANDTNGLVFVPAPANNAISRCLTGCISVFGRSDRDRD